MIVRVSRKGFTFVEVAVVMALVAVLSGVLYEMMYVGTSSSQKGISRLDEVSKATRLAEHLRRVLRTATTIKENLSDGKLFYSITHVKSVQALVQSNSGSQINYERNLENDSVSVERVNPEKESREVVVTFKKGNEPPVEYRFRDLRFRLYADRGLIMIYMNLSRTDPLNVIVAGPYLQLDMCKLKTPDDVLNNPDDPLVPNQTAALPQGLPRNGSVTPSNRGGGQPLAKPHASNSTFMLAQAQSSYSHRDVLVQRSIDAERVQR